MSFYEKHFFPNSGSRAIVKARTGLCLIFAILTLLAIFALILWLVLPQLIGCVRLLLGIILCASGFGFAPAAAGAALMLAQARA